MYVARVADGQQLFNDKQSQLQRQTIPIELVFAVESLISTFQKLPSRYSTFLLPPEPVPFPHSSFVIWHFPFAIRHSALAIRHCHLLFSNSQLPSTVIRHAALTSCHPIFIYQYSPFIIHHSLFSTNQPPSEIHFSPP